MSARAERGRVPSGPLSAGRVARPGRRRSSARPGDGGRAARRGAPERQAARERGDALGSSLGQIYQCHGQPDLALRQYREALALAEEVGGAPALVPLLRWEAGALTIAGSARAILGRRRFLRMTRTEHGITARCAPAGHGLRRDPRPLRRRWVIVLRLTLVCLGLAPGLVWGHAALVRSTPAQRAMLARSPDRVRLWFNEPLEARFARVSVWDGQARQVDRQDMLVGPDDPKALSVGIPDLAPGAYTVRYRVLSVDGHVVEGSFRFTVRPPRAGLGGDGQGPASPLRGI